MSQSLPDFTCLIRSQSITFLDENLDAQSLPHPLEMGSKSSLTISLSVCRMVETGCHTEAFHTVSKTHDVLEACQSLAAGLWLAHAPKHLF